MTLREFLTNPIGKGDASISKDLIKSAFEHKYEVYMRNGKKHIDMKIFRNMASDTYWFWMVIPSETERDNSYDIVIRFSDDAKEHRRELSISNYQIQIFSNVPSFAYTYAYAYHQAGILLNELSNKLGNRFTTDSPNVRNKNCNVLYDKYIFFAISYILDGKELNRLTLETKAKIYDKKYLDSHIRSLNTIMEEYRDAENKLKKKKTETTNHKKGVVEKIRSSIGNIESKPSIIPVKKMAGRPSNNTVKTVQKKKGTVKKR